MPKEQAKVKLQEKVVKYMGLSDVRVLYKSDQRIIGIEQPEKDIVWNRVNDWTIPVNDLPDEVYEYCQHDREFAIVTQ